MKSSFVALVLSFAAAACASSPEPAPLEAAHPASPLARSTSPRSPAAILDPALLAAPPKAAEGPPKASELYSCPMHPEVRRAEPGRCPVCGMELVRAAPTDDGGRR